MEPAWNCGVTRKTNSKNLVGDKGFRTHTFADADAVLSEQHLMDRKHVQVLVVG